MDKPNYVIAKPDAEPSDIVGLMDYIAQEMDWAFQEAFLDVDWPEIETAAQRVATLATGYRKSCEQMDRATGMTMRAPWVK